MGAEFALVDSLNSSYEVADPFDCFSREIADLRQRWDNRIVLERCSIAEHYLNGRLEIILYGDWGDDGISDDACEDVWNVLFGPEGYAVSCRVEVDDRHGYLRVNDLVEFPVKRHASLPKLINVAIGPLNL